MQIESLTPSLADAYEAYVAHHPAGLFYYGLRFKRFLEDLLACGSDYRLAVDDGAVRGVLPLMVLDRDGRRLYNALPFYGSHGAPLADDADARRALVASYNETAAEANAAAATMVGNPLDAGGTVDGVVHTHQDQRIGQWTPLPAEDDRREALMARIDSSARRNIRKAHRQGVTVRTDPEALDHLETLHRSGMAAIGGRAKAPRFFALLPQHFEPGAHFDLYVAERDGYRLAALLIFYFRDVVEYYMPVNDPDHRSLQPMAAILFEAMVQAAERGFRWWNWGGTWPSQEGVYRFKKKWAAEERPYTYYTQVNDPSLLEATPAALRDRFGNFYVLPFAALKGDSHEP